MENTLFYFTGSGNSLAIARRIAEELGDTRVVSIPHALEDGAVPTGKRIGLVFPTYAYGLPRMVEEFVRTASFPDGAYLFAVASSFGIPGGVLRHLDRRLRRQGSRLRAGFTVFDPRSSLIEDPDGDAVQRIMIGLNRGQTPPASTDRIDEIVATVSAMEEHRPERSNWPTSLVGGALHPLATKSFPTMAESFHVDGTCVGCGTCARVCPRGNISLDGGRPVWGRDCEMCHACIQWCPHEAIQFADRTADRPRYRNTQVTVRDMVLR